MTTPHSAEAKAKISAANKGRKHTEEAKAKIGAANKGKLLGRKRSEETKAKIAAHRLGKPGPFAGAHHSAEARAKMSAALKGKKRSPRSEETKAKISEANKGKVISEETRQKLREACARRRLLKPPKTKSPKTPKKTHSKPRPLWSAKQLKSAAFVPPPPVIKPSKDLSWDEAVAKVYSNPPKRY